MKNEILKCNCKFDVYKTNNKLYCKTHEQSLIYIYVIDGKHRYICQVGEDELLSKIKKSKLIVKGN